MRRWQTTDLSVQLDDAEHRDWRSYRLQMASNETRTIEIPAERLAMSALNATCVLRRLDIGEPLTDEAAPEIAFALGVATVTVAGLSRGIDYELAVTFAEGDGETETRTLVIECVG